MPKVERIKALTDTNIGLDNESSRGQSSPVDPRHLESANREANSNFNRWNREYHRPVGQARNNR